MTMEYIRDHYDRRFKRGVSLQVRWHGDLYKGTVVGSDGAYLRVSLNSGQKALLFHPNEVEIITLPNEPEPKAVQP